MTEDVRMWRPADGVLLLAGHTSGYAIEPRGEYVFGVVAEQPMHSRRGREHREVRPGQLVAWDPSQAHSGESGTPWFARLAIIEGDAHDLANVEFPQPVLSDPVLANQFVRLHQLPAGLEQDEQLVTWLNTVVAKYSPARRHTTPAGAKEFRLASEYLAEHPERTVSLAELAGVAGTTSFQLIRLFREHTGLPPHALHVAHRIRLARRLLEAGHSVAETAARTGFTDQSHLHRHFRRALGFTPVAYQRLLSGSS
ncbi:AraC family transcriptional regulator [Actinocrispum sp. NPDC049592]|uniref:AraC family transcriptional regulator n=1 Tax=Actinocrispum sp. NPDC049592 TaxID=3154835 RepID=UPI003419749A